MFPLWLHPVIGDSPGGVVVFILILAGYVLIGAFILYLLIRLIRALFFKGKGR
jgi:hypothetical protein